MTAAAMATMATVEAAKTTTATYPDRFKANVRGSGMLAVPSGPSREGRPDGGVSVQVGDGGGRAG